MRYWVEYIIFRISVLIFFDPFLITPGWYDGFIRMELSYQPGVVFVPTGCGALFVTRMFFLLIGCKVLFLSNIYVVN